jgi:hypothetical protein
MQARTREKGEDRKPEEVSIEHSAYVSCVSAEMSSGMEPVTPPGLHPTHHPPRFCLQLEAKTAQTGYDTIWTLFESNRDAKVASQLDSNSVQLTRRAASRLHPVGGHVSVMLGSKLHPQWPDRIQAASMSGLVFASGLDSSVSADGVWLRCAAPLRAWRNTVATALHCASQCRAHTHAELCESATWRRVGAHRHRAWRHDRPLTQDTVLHGQTAAAAATPTRTTYQVD